MAVITPQFNIQIETQAGRKYRVPAIESVRVHTSRKTEPDTATIKLPTMKGLEIDTFKKGDEVSIWFGHKESDYGFEKVFLGMISKVGPNLPVTLEAKDWYWVIKKAWYVNPTENFPVNGTSESLNDIAQKLIASPEESLDGVEILTSPDHNNVKFYGEFPLGTRNYGEVFSKLIEHGWDLFIVPGTKKLWFGPRDNLPIAYPMQNKTPIFRSGLNIIDTDLNYENSSGIRKVEVWISGKDRKSENADGIFEPPNADKNGETKKFELPGLSNDAEFNPDDYAKMLYDIHSKTGLSGHFRTFGVGYFHHWMKCKLEVGISGLVLNWHCYPSGIDYIYSPSDGFKMDVYFDHAIEGGLVA